MLNVAKYKLALYNFNNVNIRDKCYFSFNATVFTLFSNDSLNLIYRETYLNQILFKPETCLNQTSFGVLFMTVLVDQKLV